MSWLKVKKMSPFFLMAQITGIKIHIRWNSILAKCKTKLKEIQAAVFNLKYIEDLTSEEICKELNITASNYWVLIHRAKIQLRSCLESNWMLK
ncbi:MAG: DUF1492 domain-containing protein [Sphingobacteriia bacterium]|nr:MAG: DUF1492 domain-containing protein [Sphingobacteriia bacterium]